MVRSRAGLITLSDAGKTGGCIGLGWRILRPLARLLRPGASLVAVLGVAMLLAATGCKESSPHSSSNRSSGTAAGTGQEAPWIKASPNPVPAGTGSETTTVSWSTEDGSIGQVYLLGPSQVEKLFTGGRSGAKEAPWIKKGGKYEFLLYAGTDHQTVLARVTVTKE
jgi:hypothetical protein